MLLEKLGIRSFFEAVAQRITLSTEVSRPKPDKQVYQASILRTSCSLRRIEATCRPRIASGCRLFTSRALDRPQEISTN